MYLKRHLSMSTNYSTDLSRDSTANHVNQTPNKLILPYSISFVRFKNWRHKYLGAVKLTHNNTMSPGIAAIWVEEERLMRWGVTWGLMMGIVTIYSTISNDRKPTLTVISCSTCNLSKSNSSRKLWLWTFSSLMYWQYYFNIYQKDETCHVTKIVWKEYQQGLGNRWDSCLSEFCPS